MFSVTIVYSYNTSLDQYGDNWLFFSESFLNSTESFNNADSFRKETQSPVFVYELLNHLFNWFILSLRMHSNSGDVLLT